MKKNDYVIVRSAKAGVFAGRLKQNDKKNRTVILEDARRLWYWDGAASLSQLALDGTCKPETCKFPAPVGEALIFDIIEVLVCTPKSKQSITNVPVWEIKK